MKTTPSSQNARRPLAATPAEADAERVRIVSTPGTCGGKPRIAGHRITVKHIVICHQRGGQSVDEIVSDYPGITLSDVYAALAYYFDHRDEIDADIKADDEHWAEVERQNPGSLAERLQQRKADVANNPLSSG
jgi:uncharacterized protein (DUF433 family)